MKKILVLSLLVISIITTSGCSTTKSKEQTKVDSKATVSNNVEEKKNEQNSESKGNAELSQSKADANTSGTQNSEQSTAGKTETKTQTQTQTNNEEVVSYKNYKNGRYLFSLDYPSEYKVQESSTNGDGAMISSENAKITVFGSNNILNYNVQSYFDVIAKDIKEEIKYKSIDNNSFIISYESGESIVYSKYVVGSGSINTFIFTYPKEKANQYKKVVERMNSSFKTPGIDDAH